MMAQQLNVEVISNNVANMSTAGFKRQKATFQDLMYQDLKRVGSTSSDAGTIVPAGIQVGMGVRTAAVTRITAQGNLDITENNYDLAIQGRGYFRIQMPTGDDAYTRAGNFSTSSTGQLVTTDGYTVQPGITIPANTIDVSINSQGLVQVTLAGQTDPQTVGQLELASFQNPAGLDPLGDNLFMESAASGTPTTGTPGADGFGSLLQGYLETSNVDSVAEITNLITAQRAYEMNAKMITATDEMLSVTSIMTRLSFSQTWTLINAVLALWVLFSLTQAEAAVLRPHVSVTGDTVTLGDLFDDAGTASDVIIAAAPRPGAPTAISVSRISQVARRNGIAWRNTQGLTRIVVSRSGIPLAPELIQGALADAIAEEAPTVAAKGLIEVVFTGGTNRLMVTTDETPSLAVEQVAFDNRTGRFRAIVRVPAEAENSQRFRVTGRAFAALDIPVLTQRMSPGDEITEADIDWMRVPATRVSQNIIDDMKDLIGFTPRRGLRPGEPVRSTDVEAPRLVEKGSTVAITYRLANMSLSTRGRALEDGALGDTIRVVNPRSHRTIEVEVTGFNQAQVAPVGPLRVSSLK
eukprot:s1_g2311.t1